MKVLFAVNDDNISNSIITKYQQKFKEIITSKNVYYFKAIIKELQTDKTYDAIVIGEDLEPMSNKNYDAIDKFLFDQLDEISDEATKSNGEDTPIIFICSDRRNLGDPLISKLFGIGIYNALVGNDRSVNTVCTLLNKPRSKKEAKRYYKIDSSNDVSYTGRSSKDEVSENEINNIINYYKKIGDNVKKCVEAYEQLTNQYNETQLRIIINYLPIETKSILEVNSQKYQKFVTAGTTNSQGQYIPYAQNDPKNPKLDIIEKNIGQTQLNEAVIIPSTMNVANPVTQTSNTGVTNDTGINYGQQPNPYAQNQMNRMQPNPYGQNQMNGMQPNPYGQNQMNGMQPNPYGQNQMNGMQPNPYGQNQMNGMQPNPYGQSQMNGMQPNPYGQNSMMGQQNQPNPQNVQAQNPMGMNNNVNEIENDGILPKVEDDVLDNTLPTEPVEDENILPMNDITEEDDDFLSADEEENVEKVDTFDDDIADEDEEEFDIEDDDTDYDDEDEAEEIETVDNQEDSDDILKNNPIVIADDDDEIPTVDKIMNEDNAVEEDDEVETEDTVEEVAEEEPEVENVKRGRGRPRKNPVVEKKVELDENGNPIKRGRGRPKKVQNESIVENDIEDITADIPDENTVVVDDEIETNEIDDTPTVNEIIAEENKEVSEEDFVTDTEREILGDLDFIETTPKAQEDNDDEIDEDDFLDEDDELDDILNFDIQENEEIQAQEQEQAQVKENVQSNIQNPNGYVNVDNANPYLNKNPYMNQMQNPVNQQPNVVAQANNNIDDYDEATDFDTGDMEMYEGNDLSDNAIPLYGENGLQNINTNNQLMSNNDEEPKQIGANFIAGAGKIAAFVGTEKNGTSFIVNNLAQMLSQNGIRTAVLDLTKNKNDFYMFTNNDADLMQKATESLGNLSRGDNTGLVVSRNLTIFTALPTDIKESYNYDVMLSTASNNYEVVLLDCDFDTDPTFFVLANEMYLVQSMDVFTIQPFTKFLSDLKVKGYLDKTKLRIIVNKVVRTKMLNSKVIIGGMSKYNEPSMSLQRDIFNAEVVPFVEIPFEEQNYAKYLESVVMCKLDLNGYTQQFMGKLNELKNMVYPLIAGRSNRMNKYNNYTNKKGLFGVKKNTTNYSSNVNMNSNMNNFNNNYNNNYNNNNGNMGYNNMGYNNMGYNNNNQF